MMAGSHVIVGMVGWVAVAKITGNHNPYDPATLLIAGFSSLLPDIDHPRSWLGRRLGIISRAIAKLVGHRGVTHSFIAVLGLLALWRWKANLVFGVKYDWVLLPVVVGYLSHLAADSLTYAGVPLLWPHNFRFRIPLARTGTWREQAVVLLIAVVCLTPTPLWLEIFRKLPHL